MKVKFLRVCTSAVLLLAASNIYATPVESDAIVSDELKGDTEALDEMAVLVRAFGYKCDSISAARPMMFSRGFVLSCNKFAYSYEIEDKGGNWKVTVE